MPTATAVTEVLLRVRGTVQGVGYRPFVHRTAVRLGLNGWVRNDSEGVLIRAVKTGNKGFHQDVPAEDVIIEKAEIV